MAREATMQVIKARGIVLERPPSLSRSLSPVLYITAPMPKNSNPLKKEWFTMWNNAPAVPIAVPKLMPNIIYPIWLTLWKASNLFASCWTRANITPINMVITPRKEKIRLHDTVIEKIWKNTRTSI